MLSKLKIDMSDIVPIVLVIGIACCAYIQVSTWYDVYTQKASVDDLDAAVEVALKDIANTLNTHGYPKVAGIMYVTLGSMADGSIDQLHALVLEFSRMRLKILEEEIRSGEGGSTETKKI